MSNRREVEFVNGIFRVQSFCGGQQPSHVLIAVTHKPLTIWSHEMNHRKMESYLVGWYLAIREFQICLSFRILFLPTVVLSSSVFSSFANAQNSISSKSLVR
jgi:hypothetical protein